jgi:hypothetical protein
VAVVSADELDFVATLNLYGCMKGFGYSCTSSLLSIFREGFCSFFAGLLAGVINVEMSSELEAVSLTSLHIGDKEMAALAIGAFIQNPYYASREVAQILLDFQCNKIDRCEAESRLDNVKNSIVKEREEGILPPLLESEWAACEAILQDWRSQLTEVFGCSWQWPRQLLVRFSGAVERFVNAFGEGVFLPGSFKPQDHKFLYGATRQAGYEFNKNPSKSRIMPPDIFVGEMRRDQTFQDFMIQDYKPMLKKVFCFNFSKMKREGAISDEQEEKLKFIFSPRVALQMTASEFVEYAKRIMKEEDADPETQVLTLLSERCNRLSPGLYKRFFDNFHTIFNGEETVDQYYNRVRKESMEMKESDVTLLLDAGLMRRMIDTEPGGGSSYVVTVPTNYIVEVVRGLYSVSSELAENSDVETPENQSVDIKSEAS